VAHDPKDPQPVNHAILTFQPTPSIPLLAITERLVGNLVGPTKKGMGVLGRISYAISFFFLYTVMQRSNLNKMLTRFSFLC
jgi:hypothetical protein